ncbi:MAG: MFS transporter [Caldisericaceae bacterium]
MSLKKIFLSFSLQGAALSAINLVLSLFVVTGLGGNVKNASIVVALFSMGNLFGSILSSMILDKLKSVSRLVFASLLGSAALTVLIAFVKILWVYYLLSLVLGTIITLIGPALTLHLNKILDDLAYRKGINYLNLFNSIGQTVGMLMGSLILQVFSFMKDPYKMRSVFIISGILLFNASIIISEKDQGLKYKRKVSIYSTQFLFTKLIEFPKKVFDVLNVRKLDSHSKKFMLAVFLAFFGVNIVFSVFSIYLKIYLNLTSQSVFLLYAINSLAANGAFYLTGLVNNRSKDRLFVRSVLFLRASLFLLMGMVGYLHFAYANIIIFTSFVVIGFSWPFFYVPLSVEIVHLTQPDTRGRIIGFFNITINSAVILASFIAGFVALRFGYVATFVIGSFFVIAGEVIFSKIIGVNT